MKLKKRIAPREMIVGYQKKIFIRSKEFHEELLRNEFDEDDEDQVGMMDRIENEYNYFHRSHIYVTGTVSVVVNKPHTDTKMFNPNYYANMKAIQAYKEYEQKQYEEYKKDMSEIQEL